MKVVKKTLEDGQLQLDVTASTAEVSKALNRASEHFCGQMGLRPEQGKSPAQVASEQLGIHDLDRTVEVQAIESLVPFALDKMNINPAFQPQPEAGMPLRRGRTFQFQLTVYPKPTYELDDYSPVSFTAEKYSRDEAAIDQQISELARAYVTYVRDDEQHELRKGDSGNFKMHVTKDGEVVKGLTADSRTFTLGQGLMPDSFEDALEGIQPGETRTFKFTGPDINEKGDLVDEEYDAEVTFIELQKETVPVIDDEWIAKNMPMYKTLADMREDFGKRSDKDRKLYYEDYLRNLAASELAKRFDDSIADEVYEGASRELSMNLRAKVSADGMKWEDFCEQQGGEQQVGMMMMLQTRQQLIQGFVLDAYYRHHKLQYSQEDLDEVCFQMDPRNPKRMRQVMEENGYGYSLREAAERLCACRHLVKTADITLKEDEDEQK